MNNQCFADSLSNFYRKPQIEIDNKFSMINKDNIIFKQYNDYESYFNITSNQELAIDILGIPAMSSKVERLFSDTGEVITKKRNKLKAETVSFLMCLKQWDKAQVIDWGGPPLTADDV